jgi:ankyrin repeat protein
MPSAQFMPSIKLATVQHKAAAERHPDVVTLLLDAGANPSLKDAWQCTPLLEAFELGNLDIAKALCSSGARLTPGSRTFAMLVDAAAHDENKLKALVQNAGLDPNMVDGPDGRTALHYACASQDRCAAERLIAVGANVNAEDRRAASLLAPCNAQPAAPSTYISSASSARCCMYARGCTLQLHSVLSTCIR